MKALLLAALIGASWHTSYKGAVGSLRIGGTIIGPTTTATIEAHGGVIVINIDDREHIGFYDDRLLAIEVRDDQVATIGSRIVWAGTPEMVASR